MKQTDILRKIALSFPQATEEPHFEKTSFRVNRKIFATYLEKEQKAFVKLSEKDQDLYTLIDRKMIYPVPNKWGKQGWTIIELNRTEDSLLKDILTTAYLTVAPKKLQDQLIKNGGSEIN